MAVLTSSLSNRSETFTANVRAHQAAMETIHQAAARAVDGGGQQSRERHVARGKILPRGRVARRLQAG